METDLGSASPPPATDPQSTGTRRGSDTRWRSLFEASLDGILLADSAGAIYAANPAACRLLGRPEQEIIAAGLAGISGASDPRLFDAIREGARTGTFRGQAVLRRHDGVEIPVELSVFLTDENGVAAGTVVFRDTPAYGQAEAALRKSEAMLARAQQVANLGSWEWDIASGEVFWSEQHYRILGLRPGEFRPTYHGFLALVHPEDRARVETAVKKALEGEPYRIQFRVPLPDSSVRHVYAQSDVDFDAAGTPVRMVGTVLDITERKRTEEALLASEEMHRLMIETTSEGVWLIDRHAVITYVNPQMGRMLGYAPEEMLGRPAWDFIFEEDRPAIERTFSEMLETKSGLQTERRYRCKDGSSIRTLVSSNPLYDREGRLTGFLGMLTDITGRKRMEEQLREQAETLQKLMDVAPVALLVAHDPECHEVTGNRAGNVLFQAEAGANLSLTPEGGVFPDWRFFRDGVAIPPEQLPVQVAAAGGIEVKDWEAEAFMPDGSRKFIWGQASPLRDAGGRVRGAVAAYQDITASRQRTEDAIRESEERFRLAADTAPVIMWVSDLQQGTKFFNRQVTVFTGLTLDQLRQDWSQVIHPDDREAIRTVHREAVEQRADYQLEYRARRADGEYRHMLSTACPRYIGDAYAGHVGTIIDVTDLKRRQEEDLARQKLESLGTLAGGIAHDFNNLLGSILSQAELASAEVAEGGSAETEFANIRAVATRGAEIVRQLMVFAGQETDTLQLVNVSRLIEGTSELLKVVVSRHADLQIRLGPDVPAIRANPATLRQVLINLVSNASDAVGDQDGVIRVATARVTVKPDSSNAPSGLPPGDYLQLEVSDTGCGMTPEIQAKIFEPFYSTKSQGRGLGLPVVHGIVRRLGGEITVRSQPRQGTTFQILLPGAGQAPAESRDSPAAAGENPQPVHGTVLVVEDEEVLRLAVSRMLRKHGLSVLEAADGSAALEMLRSHADDLTVVLLDVTLPGVASTEVLREARLLRPDLRVVLTSAYGEGKVAAMFAGLGRQPFLRKPYRQADLLKILA